MIAPVVLAGCGSDDNDEPDVEPAPTVFIPAPLPTISDPNSVLLTPVAGAIPGYTVSLPADWTAAPPQGGEDVFNLMDGQRIVAQMAVLCEPPLVRDGLQLVPLDYARNDIVYVEQLRGQYDEPKPFTIRNTIPAASLRYQTTLGPVTVRQKIVHFTIDACHWSLRLRVFAPGAPEDILQYESLFDRMVESFTTT